MTSDSSKSRLSHLPISKHQKVAEAYQRAITRLLLTLDLQVDLTSMAEALTMRWGLQQIVTPMISRHLRLRTWTREEEEERLQLLVELTDQPMTITTQFGNSRSLMTRTQSSMKASSLTETEIIDSRLMLRGTSQSQQTKRSEETALMIPTREDLTSLWTES